MRAGTLLLTSLLWAAAVPPLMAQPETVYMKARAIKIPITINPQRQAEIRELLLFVSTDQGRSWSQEARCSPDKTYFPFTAPADGVYAFTVCIIDNQGRREPQDLNAVPPNVVIHVDTQPPVVKLRAAERVGDEVTVAWTGLQDEINPDPASLKLEYRPANDEYAPWSAVSIQAAPEGQTRFRVNTPGPVMVRMSFQDRAGNQAQAINRVGGETTAAYGPGPAAPVAPVANTTGGPIVPIQPEQPAFGGGPPRVEPPAPRNDLPLPPDRPLGPPPNMAPIASSGNRPGVPGRDVFTGSQPDAITPAVASSNPRPPSTAANRPSVVDTKLINTAQLTLAYDVLRAGPSGVRRAILYVTEDDGQSWVEGGRDEAGVRKVTAALRGEGTYGFRIVLESNAGLSKGPPLSGDVPEMRIEVDLTPPEVELYDLAPDPNRRDTLILRWKATDRNLSNNQIELEYAEHEDGPWSKIADVPNTGQYSWKLPPRLPVRVYLRVKARDVAGNFAEARTPKPQLIDLHKPEGALIGISGATMQIRQ